MGADEESARTLPVMIRHDAKNTLFPRDLARSFSPIIRHNALSTAL
jgi:hypothetical protein